MSTFIPLAANFGFKNVTGRLFNMSDGVVLKMLMLACYLHAQGKAIPSSLYFHLEDVLYVSFSML